MSPSDDDLLSLRSCTSLVRLFHQRIKAPIAAKPQTLKCDPASALLYSQRLSELSKEAADAANGTTDVLLSRLAMTLEELSEWLAAHANGDVAAAADALGDRLYLLVGDAVATGLPLGEIFTAVHESNLSKLPGVTTGLGKGVKGSDYQRPDLGTLLATLAAERQPNETDMLLDED
ncbi:MAG: nucleoside triphosphate pyrophosphohydrolase family protein [Pirellulales bacterium]|nr:nucleoside triphosphate pyrophosphohydrolase family protein [Pirellulales bacterium]